MTLPVRQQWSLWRIEHALRRSDPGLVTLIANFARFALDGVIPDHERLKPRTAGGYRFLLNVFLRVALLATRLAARGVQRCCVAFAWLRRVVAGSPSFDVAAHAKRVAHPDSGMVP
jgi:hypothetical protein